LFLGGGDADGQWKLRSEVVNVAGNEEMIKIRVKEVEEKLLQFHSENHVEPLEDDLDAPARAPHYSELSSDSSRDRFALHAHTLDG